MKRYIVRQEDMADCGACSLLSVIRYYEGNVPLEIIKTDTLTTETGTNFYYLKEAGQKYGFNSRGKKVEKLNNLVFPCIVQIKDNNYLHFITIYKVSDRVTYMDPAKGIVVKPLNEFYQLFTGYVLELIPFGTIIKYEDNKLFQKIILNIYKIHYKTLILLFILALFVVSLFLVTGFNPWFLKNKKLITLVIILSFSKILIIYIKNNLMSHLNKKINITLLKNYLNQILNLPLKYLQLKKTGDLVNRINDLDNIKNLFSKLLLEILINGFLLIGGLIFLFFMEIKLTFILFFITFIYAIILLKINKKTYYKIISNIESNNNLMDKIIEYLNNIKTIKTNPLNYFKKNLDILIDNNENKKYSLDKILNLFEFIMNFFEELMMIIILIYYYHYQINLSVILIYLSIFNYYLSSLKYYLNLLPMYMYYKDVISRIKSIYEISPDDKNYQINDELLRLTDISYKANKFKPIFKNFNLTIEYGNKVLIKGPNGSGKTTLLDIIYGCIKDYKGTVLRSKNVSYINQNSKLFSGTILENIILDQKFDDKRLTKVLKIVLLDEFIKNISNGLETQMTSLLNISGGESQKIILARGLYQYFDTLLLDESLSEIALSDRKKIIQNIFKIFSCKTIIVVNHNSDDIKYDQIINLTAERRGIC